jgi:hypothetical protein
VGFNTSKQERPPSRQGGENMVKVELSVDEIEGLYINLIHYKEYIEDGPRDESYQRLVEEIDALISKFDSILNEHKE